MIVFHGTQNCILPLIKTKGPLVKIRTYDKSRKSFSTTTDLKIAKLFAMRNSSPQSIFNDHVDGVVLEFALAGTHGIDYNNVKDYGSIQDEKEIAVYNTRCLALIAVWIYDKDWKRQPNC